MFRAVSTPMLMSQPAKSLSIVEATPTTGNPISKRQWAPVCEPFPPITTRASISRVLRLRMAFSRPVTVSNSALRALPRIVPPRWRMPPTSRALNAAISPLIRPA